MDLAELGWDAVWENTFVPHRHGGLEPARVVHEDKLSYIVVGASGDRPAIITGRLRHLCPRDQDLRPLFALLLNGLSGFCPIVESCGKPIVNVT